MIALLLAAALVGPPAPMSATGPDAPVTRSEADHMVGHALWLGQGWAADAISTDYALRNCPTCRESNPGPLGWGPNSYTGTKLAINLAAFGACYFLERGGHHGWAVAVSRILGGAQDVFAVHNVFLGVRGH